MAAGKCSLANISGDDQRVEDEYIDELIRKYLYEEDMNSLYEDGHLPWLASPEADKWPGEATFPDLNCSQDFLVPELLQMESLPERMDDVQPQEELLSLLEEVITEDEKKNGGICESAADQTSSESAVKRDKIVNNSDLKPIFEEAQSNKKRPKKTPTEKKAKRSCRSQPIIMKRRSKERFIEE